MPIQMTPEEQAIQRRRAIAEAMMQRGMQPLESIGTAGGAPIPISHAQGLNKLAEGYLGQKDVNAADAQLLTLEQQRKAEKEAAIQEALISFQNQPAIEAPADELSGGPGRPEIVKSLYEQQQAEQKAALSPYEEIRNLGIMKVKYREAEQAREDTQAANLAKARETANAKVEAERIRAGERADRAASDRELRMILAEGKQAAAAEKVQAKQDSEKAKIEAKQAVEMEKKAKSASIANDSINNLLVKIDGLIDEQGNPRPGFNDAFGQWDAKYPNWMKLDKTSKAYKTLEALSAQETMSNLAKAKEEVGQSFGSMQVKEWDRFTNLARSLDPDLPQDALRQNLIDLRKEALKRKAGLQVEQTASPADATPQQPKRIKFDAQGNQVP